MKFIDDYQMISVGDHLIIGVSGGPDSVCLLMLLSKWAKLRQWDLKSVYVDHGLRKKAKHEMRFVEKLTSDLDIPYVAVRGNSLQLKSKLHMSTEEAARELRHNVLRAEALKFHQAKIALAHHLDDQVETFFIQLFKGSGLGGLSGMRGQEGNIVRPLLCVTKDEILDYLKSNKISYVNDETNDAATFLRNKVRLKLLPYIKKHFSEWNVHKTIPKIMNVLKEEHGFIKVLSDELNMNLVVAGGRTRDTRSGCSIHIESFKKLPMALQRQIIKNTLDRFSSRRNYSYGHIEDSRKLFYNPSSHKKLMLPEGIVAEKLKKAVFFSQII